MQRPGKLLDGMAAEVPTSGCYLELDAADTWELLGYIAYLEKWREQAIETYSALEDMRVEM